MDSDSWTASLSCLQAMSISICAAHGGGDVDGDDEPRPEFLCPFCAKEFDVAISMKPILLKLRMGINQLWCCCCWENCGAAAIGKIVVFLLLGKNRIVRGI